MGNIGQNLGDLEGKNHGIYRAKSMSITWDIVGKT